MFRSFANLPRAVYVLAVGTFINRAGTFLLPFLTIYLDDELKLGTWFATITMGAFGMGAILAAVIGGQLADTIGRKVVMMGSLLCGSAMLMVFPMLRSPIVIFFAVIVFAMLAEMYRPAASAMIADLVEPARRSQAYGMMYFAINLGFACGALVGGWLTTISYNWLFWGDALTCSVYSLIIAVAIRETLPGRNQQGVSLGEAPAIADAPIVSTESSSVPLGRAMGIILRDGTFMAFCACSLAIALVFMQSLSTLPLFIRNSGFTAKDYGQLISLNGICIVVLQLPITAAVSRFPRGPVVALSAILTAIGFGLTGFANTKLLFATTVVIWTIGEIMQAPLMPSIVSDLAPERVRARYMGIFGMCFSSANMLGAPIGGWILATWGGDTVWQLCFAFGMMSACGYFLMRHRIAGKPDAPDPMPAAIIPPDAITPS